MNATIYFLYQKEPAQQFTCKNTVEDIERNIRYWMEKSPGIYEVIEILVIPDDQKKDWMYVQSKMRSEEVNYAEKMREKEERATLQRLKAKYDKLPGT
jgi:hypothetical protein